ncbi:hypothetical protein HQO38_16140 [Rhodococcus fascians]|uniref:hypothetical protein n=1 Tax=Rhodococcoides fascians TaxID=1828 RepID=UPI001C9258AB|nr:hypothetical protein [Rhodococcus fascians]MBY4037195.1 hypothetical protein [Rhodococcus fascians]MBY4139499.1 hypothetical protein [Rhodococcus fascians]MBY4217966.1 hypothetical protein [Rhodococcus fascians]MBY4223968.1 hypothetical protein [Rhodococcus fascians]MBY4233446.1 hypothetical protein [Rhodococcus fascians]
MNAPASSTPRKRRVTPETMAEAGIALTLPKVTVKSVADALGVSIVAIYNNIDGPAALKALVAEEILRRWSPPLPRDDESMHDALLGLSSALRVLVLENPGIAEYLIGLTPSSVDALRMADTVQTRYRVRYELTSKQATWAVITVSEHALALAQMVYNADRRDREYDDAIAARTDLDTLPGAYDTIDRGPDGMFLWSMRTVVVGTLALIEEPDFERV